MDTLYFPGYRFMSRSLTAGSRALVFIWVGLSLCSSSVAADPRADFKRGIEAADLGRWENAIAYLKKAIEGDPRESTDQVFLSGVFSRPYLPHFYLASALMKAEGTAHCEEAMVAWEESQRQGVVSGFRRQLRELQEGRRKCFDKVLPDLTKRAEQAARRATREMAGVDGPLASPALEDRRLRLIADLQSAQELLDRAKTSSDLGILRTALKQSIAIQSQASDLRGMVSAQHVEAMEGARAGVRRSIADAEGAKDALGEVDLYGAEERQALEAHFRSLEGVKDRLAQAKDLRTIEQIQRSMTDAAAAFDLARSTFASRRRAQPAPPPSRAAAPSTLPARVDDVAQSSPRAARPRISQSRSVELEPIDPLLESWIARANRLLAEAGAAAPEDGRLLRLQRDRLRDLAQEAAQKARSGAASSWIRRLRHSSLALRLIVGIEAYFEGELRRAQSLLSTDLLNDEARGGEADDERAEQDLVRAQILLFRAGARFRLFRLGGEVEEEMKRRAVQDVLRSLVLNPKLEPSAEIFSPPFREFFENRGSNP